MFGTTPAELAVLTQQMVGAAPAELEDLDVDGVQLAQVRARLVERGQQSTTFRNAPDQAARRARFGAAARQVKLLKELIRQLTSLRTRRCGDFGFKAIYQLVILFERGGKLPIARK